MELSFARNSRLDNPPRILCTLGDMLKSNGYAWGWVVPLQLNGRRCCGQIKARLAGITFTFRRTLIVFLRLVLGAAHRCPGA
jgi:hypothetical protein